MGIVELACQGEEFGCALVMGGEALLLAGWCDGTKLDGPWGRVDGTVDEEDGAG